MLQWQKGEKQLMLKVKKASKGILWENVFLVLLLFAFGMQQIAPNDRCFEKINLCVAMSPPLYKHLKCQSVDLCQCGEHI